MRLRGADLGAQRVYAGTCHFLGSHCARDPLHGWLQPGIAAVLSRGEGSPLLRLTRHRQQAALARLEATD